MDTADLNYTEYGVFTEEELNEIRTFEEKELPTNSKLMFRYLVTVYCRSVRPNSMAKFLTVRVLELLRHHCASLGVRFRLPGIDCSSSSSSSSSSSERISKSKGSFTKAIKISNRTRYGKKGFDWLGIRLLKTLALRRVKFRASHLHHIHVISRLGEHVWRKIGIRSGKKHTQLRKVAT
jgi:hypothetical protein